MNKQVLLKSRPTGKPAARNFEIAEAPSESTKEGELLVKAKYVSVDPYMRGRMSDAKSYVPPFEVGKAIEGSMIAEVTKSRHPDFKEGDIVLGSLKWQKIQTVPVEKVSKLAKNSKYVSYYLGILGMPGVAAYFGLLEIGKPVAGETVVISGAAGAVGMVAGQIARIKGCRVVGITGTDKKKAFLVNKLKFDEVINYHSANMRDSIAKACPNGVDIYFDNVGGEISDAVLANINKSARIIICGQISLYNNSETPFGPRPQTIILQKSALMQGFIVSNYASRFSEGVSQLTQWLDEGKLDFHETIIKGFDKLPEAFIGLFDGDNMGKMLVEIE